MYPCFGGEGFKGGAQFLTKGMIHPHNPSPAPSCRDEFRRAIEEVKRSGVDAFTFKAV